MSKMDLIEIARKFNEYITQNGLYNINVIDELHANENAHSRILTVLLGYKGIKRDFPILKSFLAIPAIQQKLSNKIEIYNPLVSAENERIDTLIEEPGKFAIIVENKIHDAVDQDSQIERYIKKIKAHNIREDNIFVIYLTKDGSKRISDESLTQNAKKNLGYSDELDTGRFIPINYKYDILEWLEKHILPNCPIKEQLLISAIIQYTDHLKGLFGIRNTDLEQLKNEFVKEEMDLKTIKDCDVVLNDIEQLRVTTQVLRNEFVKSIVHEKIELPFNAFLQSKVEGFITDYSRIDYYNMQLSVIIPQLTKSNFGLETDGKGIYFGLYNKNIEDPEGPQVVEKLKNIEGHNFKQTTWWAGWEYHWRNAPGNTEFWEEVNSGTFEKGLERIFSVIYDNVISND